LLFLAHLRHIPQDLHDGVLVLGQVLGRLMKVSQVGLVSGRSGGNACANLLNRVPSSICRYDGGVVRCY
jgi:hypothetical protein